MVFGGGQSSVEIIFRTAAASSSFNAIKFRGFTRRATTAAASAASAYTDYAAAGAFASHSPPLTDDNFIGSISTYG